LGFDIYDRGWWDSEGAVARWCINRSKKNFLLKTTLSPIFSTSPPPIQCNVMEGCISGTGLAFAIPKHLQVGSSKEE
jgi:hypothetical protein